ncbi:tetratricopeptide repeat protein [Adhaeribacter sp. BT258]|uniref:Tetratricopeptide repeat protein n=1 Tax=Adhaeribacter terrigena TaxID=2793070 RepID=A0ABS1C4G9_9BACT|nr:tetratricopeptide repeat protein [Adhaeribacter terrigena]MBK0404281.1 tetratricopeptide repeat protein [Adhaeribacter terrigena]
MNNFRPYIYSVLAVALFLAGCSGSNPISKLYHNVAARDNGYFLAREKMKEAEAAVAKSQVYDYNRPLAIFPSPNETSSLTIAPMLEDVIKKASFPIQRHKTSNWVDDSYILVGKARFYKGDFDDAIKTFKYVNTISKDVHIRQLALVWLMRSYLKTEEYDNALAVSDFIKKEKLNKQNAALYYLARAQYYTIQNDLNKTIENLEYAVPLISKKDERGLARFTLAQLYQQKGENKKAYAQYNKILKRNPPYELGFFSKLNMGQVTELSNPNDKKRIEKYYAKLLKDLKNEEYRDKIYYEMAKFELKQNNYNKALEHLASSTKASVNNPSQKAYSFLLAGQTYYEKLQNYRLAQAYYDSTTKIMPPTAPEYLAVTERRDILTAFTTQLFTVEIQDSLITLARLDTAAFNKRLNRYIAGQRKKLEEEEARIQAALIAGSKTTTRSGLFGQNNQNNQNNKSNTSGGLWYFDNPAMVGTARAEFIRTWGNRKLQDNWRRSSVEASGPSLQNQTPGQIAAADSAANAPKPDPAIAWREAYMRDIPFTPEKQQKAEDSLQTALFKLANIYNQQLKEPARAAETFEKLLARNPQTKYAAETYYNLYLLYTLLNDPRAATYAAKLRSEFPNSTFVRIIDQPDYMARNAAANLKIKQLYDSAYTLYEADKLKEAAELTATIKKDNPQSEINDKLAFLEILILGKTNQVNLYKDAAVRFVFDYPRSPLNPRAQDILKAIQSYESGQLNYVAPPKQTNLPAAPIAPPTPTAVNYQLNSAAPHYFVIAYPRGTAALNNLPKQYSDYNARFNQTDNLTLSPYVLGDSTEIFVVKGFPDSRRAQAYAVKQKAPQSPIGKIRGVDFSTFVISADNFPLLYKAANLEEYMAFYRKNYQK